MNQLDTTPEDNAEISVLVQEALIILKGKDSTTVHRYVECEVRGIGEPSDSLG